MKQAMKQIIRLVAFLAVGSIQVFGNPIDSMKEYQAIEKEICYEADNEKHCLACGFLGSRFYPSVRKALCQGALFGTDPARPYRPGLCP